MIVLLIEYPLQISAINKPLSRDTQYNAVFFGILKYSKDPRQDLIDMGLNPDMAVEAGKHSYLGKNQYVKYVPHSEITEKEFYSKMSNEKLIKFYITHPLRLIQAMEYTAEYAFKTSTNLGKYKQSYSPERIREFHRFTLWSDFRAAYMPKSLILIVLVYIACFSISLFAYFKEKESREIRDKIQLLWAILLISILQYPMPFMGNGEADTAKQLFLFDFIFDMMIVVSFCVILHSLLKVYKALKRKTLD
jgi:hypothetical protein